MGLLPSCVTVETCGATSRNWPMIWGHSAVAKAPAAAHQSVLVDQMANLTAQKASAAGVVLGRLATALPPEKLPREPVNTAAVPPPIASRQALASALASAPHSSSATVLVPVTHFPKAASTNDE